MIDDTIARRYGTAFFQLCEERKISDLCLEELDRLSQLFTREAQLFKVLVHPLLPQPAKSNIWYEVSQKITLHEATRQFLQLLVAKNRLGFINKITEFFKELLAEREQIKRIEVRLGFPLAETDERKLEGRIKQALRLDKADITTVHDPELLCGLVITMGDQVIDGSLIGKIKNLSRQLSE